MNKDYVDYIFSGSHHKWYVSILIPWIIKKFGIDYGSKVIDVCTGDGNCVDVFNRCGMKTTGVDRHQRENGQNIICDVEVKIPFKANTFDVAFNKSAIEHMRRPDLMVDEVCRVLKPGGKFIIMSPDWVYCYKGFYADATHYVPFTHDSIAMLLDLHGFHQTTKELFRPEATWIRNPKWRWAIEAAVAVVPYWWLGPYRFAKKAHTMSLVCGVKA